MTPTAPVDLTNCDREPIHIPGSIQGHGAMLVCDPHDYRLVFASANAAAMIGFDGALAPDTPLSDVIGVQAAHELRNAAAKAGGGEMAGIVLDLCFPGANGAFDATIHTYRDRVFVEVEPCVDGGRSGQQTLDITQTLIRRIGLHSDVEGIAAAGARLVRAMLGYDRVMVYRFLHNGAGRVIAESKEPSLGSFLGQHFPAADIPYQARRLYLANALRMISDSSYTPIPLEPPLAAGEAPVDMSFAQLRSVSPIHCEYLRDMGVGASMSISIVVEGELWGLISCHHNRPKITPMPLRIGAELFGQYFSLQIAVAERRASMLAATEARERLDAIMADISAEDETMTRLGDRLSDLSALVDADGAGLWSNGAWRTVGDALPKEAMLRLVEIAAPAPRGAIWSSQELQKDAPDAAVDPIAGAIAIPLSFISSDVLMLFRNEESHEIEWAGEPVKLTVDTPSGPRLTPRGSFETWREEVKGRSTPWSEADLSVAEAIRTYLRDVVLRQREASAEERALTEQRRRILNDELNHRVKNIITLVKSIALQTGAGATTVDDYAAALEGRLNALAFAHDHSLSGVGADLATLIEAEASLHRYGASPDRVTAAGPDMRLDDRTFSVMGLVIHEMMTNAAKYGALSAPEGRLDLAWRFTEAGDCELTWVERGGPPVTPPTRDGFGAKLIRSMLEYDLRGSVEVTYAPQGLQARFVVPAAHVRLGDGVPAPAAVHAPVPAATLDGLGVLVVEDQGLIALDTEQTLRRLGARDIRLSPSVADAESKLLTFEPDAAVLDFNLGAGTSEAIAELLEARGVPFVFATGYADNVMIPARFRHVPVVRKPINGGALAANLELARQAGLKAQTPKPDPERR